MIFKNKKAQSEFSPMIAIIALIAGSFALVVFFALWLYAFGILTETILNVPSTSAVNLSDAGQKTFAHVNNGLQSLKGIAFLLIMGQVIVILAINLSRSSNPLLFGAFVLMNMVAVVLSVIISNAYEGLLGNSIIGTSLSSFVSVTFIMLHLEIVTTVIAFVGVIFLLINISRDREMGGSVI